MAVKHASVGPELTQAEFEAATLHIGGEETLVTTADVANSTTTFADITGLSFAVVANKTYIFEAWLIFQSSTSTVGIKVAGNGPASPTAFVLNAHIPINITLYASDSMLASRAYDTGTPSVSVDTINANLLCEVRGILRNGASAGTFALRFAAEAAGTVTIKAGSVLRYKQVD